jgi:hypothetical protein
MLRLLMATDTESGFSGTVQSETGTACVRTLATCMVPMSRRRLCPTARSRPASVRRNSPSTIGVGASLRPARSPWMGRSTCDVAVIVLGAARGQRS